MKYLTVEWLNNRSIDRSNKLIARLNLRLLQECNSDHHVCNDSFTISMIP